ncbi:DNA repair protein RecO [Candidatus Magnetoovum chiemensis]|nr:DNA repair protein RecO [Candidatus Magnetoovum chiemensis]
MRALTDGVVIKTASFGEADLIVSVYTADFGFIQVFAKSPRKIKSRFGSALEPCSYNKIEFIGKEQSALPRLIRADIISPFQRIREQLDCFVKVSELFEITQSLIPEKDPNSDLFNLLIETLTVLDKQVKQRRFLLFYKIKLLSISGYLPRLSGCAVCGKAGKFFYFSEGSVICGRCIARLSGLKHRIPLSAGALALFEKINAWQWHKLNRIYPSDCLVDELESMIRLHVMYTANRTLKTSDFIKEYCCTKRYLS